jgi:large subunit ribosomal protein L21
MYAVVEIKGHQYKVKTGDIIDVERIDAEVGASLDLDQVLFIGGDAPKVGTPSVAGAKVVATVKRQARSRKIIIFKRKPGNRQTKNGHRQHYTCLEIKDIKA